MDFDDTFDRHILPNQIKKLNVSFLVKEFKETFGGTAGNIVYNLSLIGLKPTVYGTAGNNFERYRQRFLKMKADISGIKVYPKILTATAYIITDKNNNQITGFFPGTMAFRTCLPEVKKGDIAIVAPANAVEMLDLCDWFFKKQIFFIFDPGQQIINFTKRQLKDAIGKASLLIVNDYELSLALKITGLNKSQLLKLAGTIINTLGPKGSVVDVYEGNKSKCFKIPAIKTLKAKDPTGAGDAYRAGLIKGLIDYGKLTTFNMPWQKIGRLAGLTAVYAVENYGTQNHFYTQKQFKKRLSDK